MRTVLGLLFCLWTGVVSASDRGAAAFQKGDFKQAVAAFAEAERSDPNDLRIAYNLGTAQAAAGLVDDAVASLRKSALSKDLELASKSLILIGDIAVGQAKTFLAPQPADTPSNDRTKITDFLVAAEKAYVEALELKPTEADALRKNVEQIRSLKVRIDAEWEQTDRKKKRKELELPQRFDWLEHWEREIRTALKRIAAEPDSPKKYQAFYEASKNQRRFLEEISPLKESLRQSVGEESSPPLVSAVDRIGESANAADAALRNFQGKTAVDAATKTVEQLDFLRNNLSPFEAIVQNAVKKQESLCKENEEHELRPEDAKNELRPDVAVSEEQAWEQKFVAAWMPVMVAKAKQELETPSSSPQAEPNGDPQAEQATENRRKSMDLAVQYGPEIESLTADAADRLKERNFEAASPKQERAMELLREILKPLQQDQQKDQQQNQQQNDQQGDQQKNQQQDQQQKKQDSKDQQEGDREQKKNDEQQKDENKSEAEKQEQKQGEKKELTPQEKKEELEKAQRMLRQVRRRQQEADEKREKVRALLMQAEPVEKDW